MHSFLIVTKNKNKASSYISNFLKEKGIHPIDISLHSFEKAMGIEDVRNIQKTIILKPFKGKAKAVVIEAYENITIEAQNALLKVLEEPPANTLIIISTSKKELLLPTIISRCKIIELEEEIISISNDDASSLNDLLNIILSGKTGDKLKIAQDISKNKNETFLWLEKMAIFVRQKLIENYNDYKYSNFLRQLQKTYAVIKSTNVNQRIALENLFLSFNPYV